MHALRRVAAALLFFALPATGALAAPYPDEGQLREAIAGVAGLLRGEGMAIEIIDARKAGVTRPLMAAGLHTGRNVCMVFYNPKPAAILGAFFERMPDADLPLWLRAVAVHEITHCVEQREAYVLRRFDRILPPGIAAQGMTIQGYVSAQRAGSLELWGEVLADIAAVLWLQQAVPAEWRRFAGELARLREELAARNPSHQTTAWLRAMLEADARKEDGGTLFDAAMHLRNQYRAR